MTDPDIEGLDLDALHTFFTDHVDDYAGTLRAELVTGGRSNLTYRLTDGVHSWILRRPPLGTLTSSAHDMAREYRVIDALGSTDVPVAPTTALDAEGSVLGVPFALVENVPGAVFRDDNDLHMLSDEDVHCCALELIDTLATLHDVDPRQVGLENFGRPAGYLHRQVRRWYSQWNQVKTRELVAVETLHSRLDTQSPGEQDATIVHGDYRIDNMILSSSDPTTIRAVVDWEMATLGDPLADLGLHLVYRDPAFAPVLGGSAASTSTRMPTSKTLAERYATTSGRDLTNLDFYLALAYFKSAVIAEGIHQRHLHGNTRGDGFATVGQATEPLAEAGLHVLKGRR